MSMPKPASYSPSSRSARLAEEPGDMVGIARGAGGIDRQGHHLVVDPIEEEMEGLGAEPFALEPQRELDGEIVRGHQHIVDQPDGLGEAALGIVLGERQARRDPLLEPAQRLVEPEEQRGAEARLQGPAVAAIELADLLEAHLVEALDLLFVEPQRGDRQVGSARLLIALGDDRGRERNAPAPRPRRSWRRWRPCTVKPRARSRPVSVASICCFAAEEMADAGDVEHEIAVGRDVGERPRRSGWHWNASRRNRRRRCAMVAAVDLAGIEVGDDGAGIGEVLADEQADGRWRADRARRAAWRPCSPRAPAGVATRRAPDQPA